MKKNDENNSESAQGPMPKSALELDSTSDESFDDLSEFVDNEPLTEGDDMLASEQMPGPLEESFINAHYEEEMAMSDAAQDDFYGFDELYRFEDQPDHLDLDAANEEQVYAEDDESEEGMGQEKQGQVVVHMDAMGLLLHHVTNLTGRGFNAWSQKRQRNKQERNTRLYNATCKSFSETAIKINSLCDQLANSPEARMAADLKENIPAEQKLQYMKTSDTFEKYAARSIELKNLLASFPEEGVRVFVQGKEAGARNSDMTTLVKDHSLAVTEKVADLEDLVGHDGSSFKEMAQEIAQTVREMVSRVITSLSSRGSAEESEVRSSSPSPSM